MGHKQLQEQITTLYWVMDSGLVKDWSVALDCGAYEGHWSVAMAARFDRVIAFEPSPLNHVRAEERLRNIGNVTLRPEAIFDGRQKARVTDSKSKHSASHYIVIDDAGSVETASIDELGLTACGLIKLDVEGAEYDALQGARRTLKEFSPVLIVEVKGLETRFGHTNGAVRFLLTKLGYEQVHAARPDFVFVRR